MKTWGQMTTNERVQGSVLAGLTALLLGYLVWEWVNVERAARPADQVAFERERAAFASRYEDAGNPIVADEALADARRAAAAWHARTGGAMVGWTGRVHRLDRAASGEGLVLDIRSKEAGAEVTYRARILVRESHPAWQVVKQFSVGDRVRFSGKIDPDAQRGIAEQSLVESNGLHQPEFKVTLSSFERR